MDGAQEKVVFVEFSNGSKFQKSIMTICEFNELLECGWLIGRGESPFNIRILRCNEVGQKHFG